MVSAKERKKQGGEQPPVGRERHAARYDHNCQTGPSLSSLQPKNDLMRCGPCSRLRHQALVHQGRHLLRALLRAPVGHSSESIKRCQASGRRRSTAASQGGRAQLAMHASGLAAQARARPHTIGLSLPRTGHSPVASSCSSTPKDQLSEAKEQRPPAGQQREHCRWPSSCRAVNKLTHQHLRCCVRLQARTSQPC